MGQLILPLAGDLALRRQEQHQAQHVPLAENGRGHGGGVAVVSVGDGQGLVRALAAVDAALLHDPGQSLGQGLAQQLPLSGAGDGDHGVPVGDSGGEAAGAVEGVAELRRKVLQSPQQGILLENDLPLPGGVDLQRVALTDAHGAADLLGNDHPSQVVPLCQERDKKINDFFKKPGAARFLSFLKR